MIVLHTSKEIARAKKAGRLAAQLLNYLEPLVKPGVSTGELNDAAEEWTVAHGAYSAPLGYKGTFPKSICTSVNEVVCHGIPSSDQILRDGDIINIDVTPVLGGYHGDTSRTFAVGNVSPLAQKLIDTTRECLELGINEVKPGARLGDIGAAIQEHAEAQGFSVVRDFVGHGTGRVFHTSPAVYHFGIRGTGLLLEPGMIFTIEPMINEGTHDVIILDDEWTAITADGKLTAQFEHTLAVTNSGVEVLTIEN